MPAPIRNSQICDAVPVASASFCDKIKKALLKIPLYFCQQNSYIFNEDGSVSSEFKDDAGHFYAGDLKWSASPAVQMGWLYCNGQAVSRTTYAALFAVIGTTYGAGDGSTTFNLPDLRDKFVVGVSSTKALTDSGGSEEVTLTLAQMPSHQHQIAGRPLDPAIATNQATNEVIIDDDWLGGSISKTTDSRGSDQPHSNMPPWRAFYAYIKY